MGLAILGTPEPPGEYFLNEFEYIVISWKDQIPTYLPTYIIDNIVILLLGCKFPQRHILDYSGIPT